MRDIETEWVVHLGKSAPWKEVQLPSDDVFGIWSLRDDGSQALLLTTNQGFYRTTDGGASWEHANYNESGFTDATKVKVFVVADEDAVFALIDRGTQPGEGENPLFRLTRRNVFQRWRDGLRQLLFRQPINR